jgi:hypothetical protein
MSRTKNLKTIGRASQTEKRDIREYIDGLKFTPRDVMIEYIKLNIENFEGWFYPVYDVKKKDVLEYERLIKEKYEEILEIFPLDKE